jgi:hypothetical protein
MARPTDWSPLAGSDPVPGHPDDVAALGRRFQATAQVISLRALLPARDAATTQQTTLSLLRGEYGQ